MPTTNHTTIQIYYELSGKGEPVLFISGTGGDLRVKPNIMDSPLPQNRCVLAYDQRGLGRTEKPEIDYTMAQYADDAVELLNELGWDQVDVIGVSFGGMVAQHVALRHSERIKKLVLCCTSPGGAMPSYPLHELPDDMTPGQKVRTLMAVADLRQDMHWQAEHQQRVEEIVAHAEVNLIFEHATPAFKQGAKRQLMARSKHNVLNQLHHIFMPTLVCAGRYDGIAPVANQQILAASIPNAGLQWFTGGHLFLQQDKSAWVTILDFIS